MAKNYRQFEQVSSPLTDVHVEDEIEGTEDFDLEESLFFVEERALDEATYQHASDIFGAFGDINRLKMLDGLRHREVSVTTLMRLTGMSQSAVSHALRLLRLRGIVDSRRDGRRVFYKLKGEGMHALLEHGLQLGRQAAADARINPDGE